MHSAIPTNTTIAPANDAILQRLDREHAAAFETACRLAAADVEANGGDVMMMSDDEWQAIKIGGYVQSPAGYAASKASHAAWLAFESLAGAVAHFPAQSVEGLKAKVRILERQAQGMPAGEILEGGDLRRLGVSVLADALAYAAADLAAEGR